MSGLMRIRIISKKRKTKSQGEFRSPSPRSPTTIEPIPGSKLTALASIDPLLFPSGGDGGSDDDISIPLSLDEYLKGPKELPDMWVVPDGNWDSATCLLTIKERATLIISFLQPKFNRL